MAADDARRLAVNGVHIRVLDGQGDREITPEEFERCLLPLTRVVA